MKKYWIALFNLVFVSCVMQTIKTDATFLENRTFDEVWNASIKAIDDIDFTIDSMDKDAGFIAAESGRHVLQKAPPRLSITIKEVSGKVFVDCKILQKELPFDIGGIGEKTIHKFMAALNRNLNE